MPEPERITTRLLAAAHPGIAAGGGPGLGLGLDIGGIISQKDGADVGAPAVLQSLLSNSAVVVDLSVNELTDQTEVHSIGKGQDVCHCEKALVGKAVLGGVGEGLLHQHLAVFLDADNVAVAVGDVDQRGVVSGPAGETDVQQPGGVGADNIDGGILGACTDCP